MQKKRVKKRVLKSKKKVLKQKKKFSLLNQYKQSWNYIKECRNFIYFIIGIFVFFSILGYFIPLPSELLEQILKMLKELFDKTSEYNLFEMIYFIFFNNLRSSFFGVIFGIALGVFPIISSVFNGFLLGFVMNLTVKENGFFVLWQLFPHGIFELPAIFISLAMGLKLGTVFFEKKKKKKFWDFFLNSIKVFVFIVIPLLILAAIIESLLIVGLRM
jgi:stage II sporulation protein M